MSVSAIIHTYNSEHTLKLALQSVKWVDEIVVIDMESTDRTVEIARQAGAIVHTVPYQEYADPARNFGLSQVSSDWILVLDSDEEISDVLKGRLQQLCLDPQATAYYLPRQNWVFNYAMAYTGWWPDYQLRFFRKGSVYWPPEVHGQPQVKGKAVYLPAEEEWAILHHNYPTVESFIERLDRYTTIKAKELSKTKTKVPLPFTSFGEEFLRRFFAQEGWRDKQHGASLALLQGIYEVVVQLKVWQHLEFKETTSARDHVRALEEFRSQLDFWLADWHLHHDRGWRKWWWKLRRKLHS